MSNVFAFIDETGVLGPGSQRFYGLGLLKLEDTAPLTEAVHRTYQRVRGRLGRTSAGFELKFNTPTSAERLTRLCAEYAAPATPLEAASSRKRPRPR